MSGRAHSGPSIAVVGCQADWRISAVAHLISPKGRMWVSWCWGQEGLPDRWRGAIRDACHSGTLRSFLQQPDTVLAGDGVWIGAEVQPEMAAKRKAPPRPDYLQADCVNPRSPQSNPSWMDTLAG